MSSGTPWKVEDVGAMFREGTGRAARRRMSQRQARLDWLWKFYRCEQYDGRRFDWNGAPAMGKIERAEVARSGNIPPGFYDAGGAMVPLKFRQPSTPYYLAKIVVSRFTGLLFSAKRHPAIECDDERTQDWLTGLAEATRLWARMLHARNYGGATGSACVSFKFVKGKPRIEVHDPRWVTPTYLDREEGTLKRLEKLYQYPLDELNDKGEWERRYYWYRRLITEERDVVWPKVRVTGEEPKWEAEKNDMVRHGFGFCPVRFVQNLPLDDDVDGDPDCLGCYELFEDIDVLLSQSSRGTKANADPTVIISSDAEWDEVSKGSGNALQVERGGSASYMEMNGSGTKTALELADNLIDKALMVARCVLDRDQGGAPKTATEIRHRYSSMIEQADVLREQYGEQLIKPLLQMILKASRRLSTPVEEQAGNVVQMVRREVKLPKARVVDEETGKTVGWRMRELGEGEQIELNWPPYFEPSTDETKGAVDAAGAAKQMQLIDQRTAVGYVAKYFDVVNKAEMMQRIEDENAAGEGMEGFDFGLGGEEEPALEEGGSPAPPGGWEPGEGGTPAPPGGFRPAV